MTCKLNASRHEFGLVDFDNDCFERDKGFDHVGLDLFDIYLRVILDDELDLFFLFLFDLNQVVMPDKTQALDDFVSFSRKAGEDFFEYFADIIALNVLQFLGQFWIVQAHIIVKLVIFLDSE
jgi:hypothetical protein